MQGGTTQSYVGRGLSHATAPKRCPTTLAPFASNAGRNDAVVRRARLEPCHSAEAVPTALVPFMSEAGRNDAVVRRARLEPCHSAEAVPYNVGALRVECRAERRSRT